MLIAATSACRSVRAAIQPPTSTPIAPSARLLVSAVLAVTGEVLHSAPSATTEKFMHAEIGQRQQHEEHEVDQDRRRQQQPPACVGLGRVVARLGDGARALRRAACSSTTATRTPSTAAPMNAPRQPNWLCIRSSVAGATAPPGEAGEGMDGIGLADALRRNVAREQRIVGRVIDGVADSHQAEHRDQHPIGIHHRRHGETERAKQTVPRPARAAR